MPPAAFGPDFNEVVSPNSPAPDMAGPYGNPLHAYAASKNLAYNASLRFMAEKKPQFGLVNVMPAFVAGKNELAKTRKAVNGGTNALFLNVLLGVQNPDGLWSLTCHVDDVARVHVQALDEGLVKDGANLGVVYNGLDGGSTWDDAISRWGERRGAIP